MINPNKERQNKHNLTSPQVWEQGGFAAEIGEESKFQKMIQDNPSVLHEFLVTWQNYILQYKIIQPILN